MANRIPSTNKSTWNATFSVGDKVRVRIDFAEILKQKGNTPDDVFTITKIEYMGKEAVRPENPSGKLYTLSNRDTWEGKDLELADTETETETKNVPEKIIKTEEEQKSSDLLIKPITKLPPNFVGDFIKENQDNLLKMEQRNPELFIAVNELLTYLDKNYGDGKSVSEEARENEQEAKKEIQNIVNQNVSLIPLDYAEVVWNEGMVNVEGKYSTWSDLLDALKKVHDDWKKGGGMEYNKVKLKIRFSDGFVILERIDVGNSATGDFDPNQQSVGQFMFQRGIIDEALSKKYAFEDYSGKPAVVAEAVERTKEEIQDEITTLEESIKFVDDEEERAELENQLDGLRIMLNYL